jgi:hypothetical protein
MQFGSLLLAIKVYGQFRFWYSVVRGLAPDQLARLRPTYLNLLFRNAPPSNIPDLRWEGRFFYWVLR